jgi:uncharacterized protein (DUF1330 family)
MAQYRSQRLLQTAIFAKTGGPAAFYNSGDTEGFHMSVFYIGSYDIVDPSEFQKYPPVVLSLLPKYGGVLLASDTAALVVEGTARTMNAIIRFPSRQAALGLYNDPAYQEAKRIRQSSTRNISMVLVDEYQPGTST